MTNAKYKIYNEEGQFCSKRRDHDGPKREYMSERPQQTAIEAFVDTSPALQNAEEDKNDPLE